jgi:hypothetical protein
MEARQDKLHADRERRRADVKAFNEMMAGREAESKACKEKMMVVLDAGRKKKTTWRRGWPRE